MDFDIARACFKLILHWRFRSLSNLRSFPHTVAWIQSHIVIPFGNHHFHQIFIFSFSSFTCHSFSLVPASRYFLMLLKCWFEFISYTYFMLHFCFYKWQHMLECQFDVIYEKFRGDDMMKRNSHLALVVCAVCHKIW